ncbi:arylsulfotransferase family protein [Spirillospora sp. NPDC046719]
MQTYKGDPVLTYWEGARLTGGHGAGNGIVLDRTYSKIAEVRAGDGMDGDLHEFQLTDRGTALLTAYPEVTADLRPIGGPRDGTPVMEMTGAGSYRAYRSPWSARPAAAPAVAVASVSGGRMRVHVSWNGATDVAAWRFLTDADAARLTAAATVRRTGFETAATMPVAPRDVAEALAANGGVIGRSAVQAVSV